MAIYSKRCIPGWSPPAPIIREPGPFAFVRSADEIAADDANHATDLRDEHHDGSWRDRD